MKVAAPLFLALPAGALPYIAGLTGGSFHWLQRRVSARFEIGPSSINVEPTQPLADIGMGMPPSGSGRRPDGICSGCGVVASLLRQVVRSAGDYYLIRYEPGSQEDDDGFRPIEVAAPGRDIELSGPSGYFEPRSAKTPDPGFTPYYQALMRHPKPGLVQVAQLFYPSLSGGVSVFSNIGVHASQVEAAERDGKAVVRFVALTKATGLEAERLPQYRSLVFEREFTSTEWARLHADPRAFLHGHSQLPLAPGRYR